TSVSALVRDFLRQLGSDRSADTEFERLRRQQNELILRIRSADPGFSSAESISRDALHDRHAIR
ncbi:MAG: hypothetical protein ABIQ99_05635, partial [Thermoflexales bacterium]